LSHISVFVSSFVKSYYCSGTGKVNVNAGSKVKANTDDRKGLQLKIETCYRAG
jgi:hypothetical protein